MSGSKSGGTRTYWHKHGSAPRRGSTSTGAKSTTTRRGSQRATPNQRKTRPTQGSTTRKPR